jgi:hypothetical protein
MAPVFSTEDPPDVVPQSAVNMKLETRVRRSLPCANWPEEDDHASPRLIQAMPPPQDLRVLIGAMGSDDICIQHRQNSGQKFSYD